MKKLCLLSSVFLFCLSGIAKETSNSCVVTSEGKMDCKKISIGFNKARIILENGEKRTIPVNSINSYTIDSKVFTRLSLSQDGKPANKKVFMELIKTNGELSLYKVGLCEYGPYILDDKLEFYFLYKGDNLYLALDEKTLPNVCRLFGLKYSSK